MHWKIASSTFNINWTYELNCRGLHTCASLGTKSQKISHFKSPWEVWSVRACQCSGGMHALSVEPLANIRTGSDTHHFFGRLQTRRLKCGNQEMRQPVKRLIMRQRGIHITRAPRGEGQPYVWSAMSARASEEHLMQNTQIWIATVLFSCDHAAPWTWRQIQWRYRRRCPRGGGANKRAIGAMD